MFFNHGIENHHQINIGADSDYIRRHDITHQNRFDPAACSVNYPGNFEILHRTPYVNMLGPQVE